MTSELGTECPAPVTTSARRRTVLGAAVATGAAATLSTVLAESAEARKLPARARFATLVGKTFTATHGGHTTRWRLDAVQDSPFRPHHLSKARLAAWREADFVLVWSTKSLPVQATYTMDHRATGHFRMFAVPGRRHRDRTSVTAVFNRWVG